MLLVCRQSTIKSPKIFVIGISVFANNLGSPRKRLKLSSDMQSQQMSTDCSAAVLTGPKLPHNEAVPATKEAEVGITDYVSAGTPGFRGILKKRYTDFLVNEILPNGRVVHLQHLGGGAVSQPNKDFKQTVPSERNGTGASSVGASESSAAITLPDGNNAPFQGEENEAKQPKAEASKESTLPVGFSAC